MVMINRAPRVLGGGSLDNHGQTNPCVTLFLLPTSLFLFAIIDSAALFFFLSHFKFSKQQNELKAQTDWSCFFLLLFLFSFLGVKKDEVFLCSVAGSSRTSGSALFLKKNNNLFRMCCMRADVHVNNVPNGSVVFDVFNPHTLRAAVIHWRSHPRQRVPANYFFG